jgi:hypothetical protein
MSLFASARVKARLVLARLQGGYGHVALEGGRLVGWAWAVGRELPVLELRVAGKPIHRFQATQTRADLLSLGLPSAARGFSIALQSVPLPLVETDVQLVLETGGQKSLEVRGSPIRLAGVAALGLEDGHVRATGAHPLASAAAPAEASWAVLRNGRDRLFLAARAAAAVADAPLDALALRRALDEAIATPSDEDQGIAALLRAWFAWAQAQGFAVTAPEREAAVGSACNQLDSALEDIHAQIAASYRVATPS